MRPLVISIILIMNVLATVTNPNTKDKKTGIVNNNYTNIYLVNVGTKNNKPCAHLKVNFDNPNTDRIYLVSNSSKYRIYHWKNKKKVPHNKKDNFIYELPEEVTKDHYYAFKLVTTNNKEGYYSDPAYFDEKGKWSLSTHEEAEEKINEKRTKNSATGLISASILGVLFIALIL